jgi:hypothetical protein
VGGAGTGTAGTAVGIGGKSTCGPCPDIDCGVGYTQQPSPDGCCNVCVPLDCRMLGCPGPACGCPGIACAPGSQPIYPPDQCCPICSDTNCDEQRRSYYGFRDQVVEKYNSLGCMQDSDCTIVYESNACASSCGTPMPWFYEKDFVVVLNEYAASTCAACPPPPLQPCPAPPPPACVAGRCQFSPFR